MGLMSAKRRQYATIQRKMVEEKAKAVASAKIGVAKDFGAQTAANVEARVDESKVNKKSFSQKLKG